MSNTVANFQENRAVFRFFVTLLRFSFEPPLYKCKIVYLCVFEREALHMARFGLNVFGLW